MDTTKAAFPTITVFVPARNSAVCLPRSYQSLLEQSYGDFELLIVDDGSTDTTKSLVDSWITQSRVTIRYFFQESSGTHIAYNRAIEKADGGLFLKIDPGDRLLPDALEVIVNQWAAIVDKERYAGMLCTCCRESGDIIGTPFTRIDTDYFALRLLDKVAGDKGVIYHTSKLKEHSFPDIRGETVPEPVLHNRMSRGHLFQCIPQPLIVKHEIPGDRADPERPKSPAFNSSILMFNELNYFKMPLKTYLLVNSSYVRLSLLQGRKLPEIVRGAINKNPLFAVAFFSGFYGAAKAIMQERASRKQ